MAVDHRRFLNFDPAAKELHDYLGNLSNKDELIKKLDYLMSGVWGYFYRASYDHCVQFKKSLLDANSQVSQLAAIVTFYAKEKESAISFVKEMAIQLFPKDNKRVNQQELLEESADVFIKMAEVTIKTHNDELDAKQKEIQLAKEAAKQEKLLAQEEVKKLEEKKRLDYEARLQLVSETSTIQARALSMKTFGIEEEEKKLASIRSKNTGFQKITTSDLTSARTAMGSFFAQRFKPANPNNLPPDELKAEQNKILKTKFDEHKKQVEMKKQEQAKKEATSTKEKLSMTAYVAQHKKKVAEKKRLQEELKKNAPSQWTPDPFHRKPMP